MRMPAASKISALVCLLLTTTGWHASDPTAQIESYLVEQVQKQGIPGLAVTVVRDEQVVYTAAFGGPRLGAREKLTPRHVFHMASVSKPFVATAIMQLVERGRMRLDAKVTEYLPYFRLADDRYRDITIRQMLNHTSGMPDVLDYEWEKPQYDGGAAERYVRQMQSEKMHWAPGGGVLYSNMAFDALGDVIAKVSGMSFEEYIKTNILEPLRMNHSSFVYPEIERGLRTSGHVGSPARPAEVYPYNRRHAPSSTLNSNVIDLAHWMIANLNRGEYRGRRILEEKSYDLLWTGTVDSSDGRARIGLSWFIGEHGGRRTVYHSGQDLGFRSLVLLAPDEKIGVAIAANWDQADRTAIAYKVLDFLLAGK